MFKSAIKEKQREFEELAMEHVDALYRVALKMTFNDSDAEDLVQETCFKAFKSFHQFQKDTNFKAWLFKIETNTFINKYRKESKEPKHIYFDNVESFCSSVENEINSKSILDDALNFTETLDDDVKKAVDSLPQDFRLAFILSVVEGFSYKEISEILSCPMGTVMSKLYRSRQMLKEKLADYGAKHGFNKNRIKQNEM